MDASLEKFEKWFEEVVRNPSEADKFFVALWPSVINLPKAETLSFLEKVKVWALEHEAERPKVVGLAGYSMGITLLLSEKYEESVRVHMHTRELFEEQNDPDGIAICNITLGSGYRTLGDVELALRYLLDGVAQLEQSGMYDFTRSIGCYHIGGIYAGSGQYEKSMIYYEKTYKYAPVPYMKAHALSGMGEICMLQRKYKEAREYFERSQEENGINTENAFATRILTDLANWHLVTGDMAEALRYNELALAMRKKMKFAGAAITNMLNIADIYCRENRTSEAINMLTESLDLAEAIKVKPKMLDIHRKLSDFYNSQGDTARSYEHFRQFHLISEEVNREDTRKKIKNLELVMEAEQTRKENVIIKAQKAEIDKQHEELKKEKKKSDDLLLNILPAEVAEELKETGKAEARHFDDVSVLFTDFVEFTKVAERMTPQELVNELHSCFKNFDQIISRYGIEKIKTIGDAYLAVAGLPHPDPDHALNIVAAAKEILQFMKQRSSEMGDRTFRIRIGIHSGPLVAGIVGVKKFAYDIWGDTVNTAARMEQSSTPFHINISQATYQLVNHIFTCIHRGAIHAKNKGDMDMYFVVCD